MRVSTGYQFDSYKEQIALSSSRLFEVQRQISTGKRIFQPSDDPTGVRVSLSLRNLRSGLQQYDKNLQMAKGFLGFSETALSEVGDLLKRSYQLAVQGASSATEQNGREAMISEVNEIQKRILELANSTGPYGEYLFAGQATQTKPFTVAGGVLTYNGDDNDMQVEASPTDTLVMNTPGRLLFSQIYQRLEDLKTNLQGGDIGALSGISIPDLQASLDQIQKTRGIIGAKIQTVEAFADNYARRSEELSSSIADVEEVDLTEAIVNYQKAQTAYSAALQVAARGFNLSLMDFIK
jgi:flagellar hook-associated protein 3 FlgL